MPGRATDQKTFLWGRLEQVRPSEKYFPLAGNS